MTTGPLISPEMFREFCFDAMKTRIESIKRYKDKVCLHSCGNTRKLMDQLIETGIDCYQSLQTGANMELEDLIREYGDKICFWGGIAVETLIGGTPEEVRREVRRAIQTGKEFGGFILGSSHSIPYGIKYENFMALLDEHDKCK